MPPSWTPQFEFFEALLDEDRLIILVDLGAARCAPVAGHDLRLQIRVKMRRPREDGLRSQAEAPDLFALEDRLVAGMQQKLDGLFLGRFVARGFTTFVFMLPGARGQQVPQALTADPEPSPYHLHWLTESDPSWRFYWDFLFPDPFSHQRIMNRQVLRQLEERGDRMDLPRRVDHWAHLPNRDACTLAAQALAALGYGVETPRAPGKDAHPRHWTLPFHKDSALDEGQVDDATWEILQVIEPLRGSYDGWGAPVVRDEVH
jgi:regulator of RNase E activity RraB